MGRYGGRPARQPLLIETLPRRDSERAERLAHQQTVDRAVRVARYCDFLGYGSLRSMGWRPLAGPHWPSVVTAGGSPGEPRRNTARPKRGAAA